MSDLSIQKDRATITAIFRDSHKVRGDIFLAAYSASHYGHQKVADLLESNKNFLPILIKEEDRIEFVNKNQLVIVEGELASQEDEEKLSIGLFHIEKVKIYFINDDTMEGAMLSEVPPERSRLSDCLNLPQKFINMIKEGRYLYLNKRLIMKVESLTDVKKAPVEEEKPEGTSENQTIAEAPPEGIPDDVIIS